MLRHKMLAVAAISAVAVTLAASPAHAALRYVGEPTSNGSVPGCSLTRTVLQTWTIDNPRKDGFQKWGTGRVVQARCYTSVSDAGFTGVWTEAKLDFAGDSLKTTIGVRDTSGTYYYMSDWDARGAGVWHDSPVLQRPSGANYTSLVETSADGVL